MPTLNTIRTLEIMDNVTKIYGSAHLQDRNSRWMTSTPRSSSLPLARETSALMANFLTFRTRVQATRASETCSWCLALQQFPAASIIVGGLQTYGLSNYAQVSDQRYYIGAYFQDDWKTTPKLTLNLGLRWDHYTPYQEIHGRQANFIQTGGGAGDSGTYYMPKRGCSSTPTSSTFQALLASYNIAIDCTSNNATGNAQNLNFAPRHRFCIPRHSQKWWFVAAMASPMER